MIPVECLYLEEPREAGTETALMKVRSEHQQGPKEREAMAVHRCKFGSKRSQRQRPQNREKLIEYEMSDELSRGHVNAGVHGSLGVPNRVNHLSL